MHTNKERKYWHLIAFFLVSTTIGTAARTETWYHECQDADHQDENCGYATFTAGGGESETCRDDSSRRLADCRRRSLLGECLVNPEWMHVHCPVSCGLCAEEPRDEPCHDRHTNCPHWAAGMECFANPAFMSRSCPKSCWLCVNATELRHEGIPEKEILRRFQFSQTDFGQWQAIPDNDDAGRIRDAIKNMEDYARNLKKLGAGTLCNNVHHECAQWKVELGTCERNLDFMLSQCSLACHFCHLVEEYHQCRQRDGSDERIPVGETETFRSILSGKNLLLDDDFHDLQDFEWIVSEEYSRLWTRPQEKLREIVKVMTSSTDALVWRNAENEVLVGTGSDVPQVKRSGRTAFCDHICQTSETAIGTLVNGTAQLLRISPAYLEPLEFVHYQRGERFSAHSDFRIHDTWRHSGSRILTVFVTLQKAKEGGSMGFPEYDWLQVENPEILSWPTVDTTSKTAIRKMKSEQLPVVEGELYGVYLRVRLYPFDSSNPCS